MTEITINQSILLLSLFAAVIIFVFWFIYLKLDLNIEPEDIITPDPYCTPIYKIKKGSTIELSPSFKCTERFPTRWVHEDKSGLFFTCLDGRHYLKLLLNEHDIYVGIRLIKS